MPSSFSLLVLSTIPSARAADYSGDGIDDLVVGVSGEIDIGGVLLPGGVQVIRGSASGLTATGDAFIHQGTTGVVGINDEREFFGRGLGAGDVNGDGTDDLIVGGPGETVGGIHTGAVWLLELEATRMVTSVADSQELSQNTTGVVDTAEEGDLFGQSIAVADFDGDGYDDVVVGIPGENVGTTVNAGAVASFPGGPGGMSTTGDLYYDQGLLNVIGSADTDDAFGSELAAGDFDSDGYADLAIGVPGEDWAGTDEGGVHVMYGSSIGPGVVSPNDELWSAGEGSAVGTSDDDNACGSAVATGDFDGDGYDDLAIGCPGYDLGTATDAGAVLIVYGGAAGLDDSELWTQNTAGVSESAEDDDRFGEALISGDFDGDGYDDLAIAAPTESFGSYTQNGVVQVLMGSVGGITDDGDLLFSQDAGSDIMGTPRNFEEWGQALAAGDWDGDGRDDLAVGSPFDSVPGVMEAGAVNVFYGTASGPSVMGNQLFHQNVAGIDDVSEESDWFGLSLR
jgi:hypothetical protein